MTNNDTPKAGDVYLVDNIAFLISTPYCKSVETGEQLFDIINEDGSVEQCIPVRGKKIGINGKFDPNGEPKITFDKAEG